MVQISKPSLEGEDNADAAESDPSKNTDRNIKQHVR